MRIPHDFQSSGCASAHPQEHVDPPLVFHNVEEFFRNHAG